MRVVWVTAPGAGTEEEQALVWLRGSGIGDVRAIPPDELTRDALSGAGAVWIHAGTATPTLPSAAGRALDAYLTEGGGLLLTMLATPLVVPLGLEQSPPGHVSGSNGGHPGQRNGAARAEGSGGSRGLQGWGPHPLFDGFVRGTDCWRGRPGERATEATYVRPRWPVTGRVVGVERRGGELNADKAVAWEYAVGAGRVLCIGAYLQFATSDASLAAHRDRLVRNALSLFRRRAPREPSWWPHPYAEHPPLDPAETPVASFGPALTDIGSAITLTSVSTQDDPFTVAGRRALVVGGERSGPMQIWIHPLCVFAGGTALRVDEEVPLVRSVEVAPEQIVRHMQTRTRYVEERIFVPLNEPSVVLEYRYRRLGKARADLEPAMLDLRLALPLRLEWPMPIDALHPVRVARSSDRGTTAIMVVGADERFRSLVCIEGRAEIGDVAIGDVPRITVHASLAEPLRVTFHASVGGLRALSRAARGLARGGVRSFALRRAEWTATLQDERLALRSPLAALDTAIEWAKVRLASFVASSPAVGTGLMAGFAEAGAEDNVSRPGSAWFFGRHTGWSGMALLGAGMFEEALGAIEFLAATQDISGRIASEVTTSGAARYAAADATPLFLRLVAKYASWSGDLDRVRALWPNVLRALDHVFASDRDGDGLPEEDAGGGLGELGLSAEASTSTYAAACWIAALDALVPVARHLGEEELAVRCHDAATTARRALDRELFDDASGRHALERTRDGIRVTALTALAAVPIALGIVGEVKAEGVLDALEAEGFTTAWGVRLLDRDDPAYDPASREQGAVMPLLTGWMALAEFAQHRQEEGYRYLLANAMLCYDRAKGAFDEALHGDERRGAGGSPDHASSAAMVIAPLVDGMLGAAPDAPAQELRLTPHWPREWTRAVVTNLRVGDTRVELRASEGCLVDGIPHDGVRYALTARPAGSITLVLEHPVEGRSFETVLLDGVEVEAERVGTPACPHVRVAIESLTSVEVQFVGRAIVEG